MSDDGNESFSTRFLRQRPELKKTVQQSAEFRAWRDRFKTVRVDDEEFFVVGGDMLKDEDEMVLDWARKEGIVGQDDINRYFGDDE